MRKLLAIISTALLANASAWWGIENKIESTSNMITCVATTLGVSYSSTYRLPFEVVEIKDGESCVDTMDRVLFGHGFCKDISANRLDVVPFSSTKVSFPFNASKIKNTLEARYTNVVIKSFDKETLLLYGCPSNVAFAKKEIQKMATTLFKPIDIQVSVVDRAKGKVVRVLNYSQLRPLERQLFRLEASSRPISFFYDPTKDRVIFDDFHSMSIEEARSIGYPLEQNGLIMYIEVFSGGAFR